MIEPKHNTGTGNSAQDVDAVGLSSDSVGAAPQGELEQAPIDPPPYTTQEPSRLLAALEQLFCNALLWVLALGFVSIPTLLGRGKYNVKEVKRFIDPDTVGWLLLAGVLLYSIFWLITRYSRSSIDRHSAAYYASLAVEELASISYNLGSLLLIAFFCTYAMGYLAGMIIFYGCGLLLKIGKPDG